MKAGCLDHKTAMFGDTIEHRFCVITICMGCCVWNHVALYIVTGFSEDFNELDGPLKGGIYLVWVRDI